MTVLKLPRTVSPGDLVVTLLVFAAGVVTAILAVRSVPLWWTTKFQLPFPILTTFGLAGCAFFSFLVLRGRLLPHLYPDPGMPYVANIGRGAVDVWEGSVEDRPMLRRMGGKRTLMTPWRWSFQTPDEPTLVRVLTMLRDAGVGFKGDNPRDWTPSDEFMALRERGLVSGDFKEVDAVGVPRKR
ncbi:MAG TPA: hypothetical protein VFH24_01825 [Gemmatimonadales bacterium]|nr:hypothetical protein [Gemmatimonadales bacterium]